jgi:hypothetical protein
VVEQILATLGPKLSLRIYTLASENGMEQTFEATNAISERIVIHTKENPK